MLRTQLVEALGRETWAAGYVDALFSIGEHLSLLDRAEVAPAWEIVGVPPGPWTDRFGTSTRRD